MLTLIMMLTIDTDKAVKALSAVGFEEIQARTLIDTLIPVTEDLATKEFLSSELEILETRIESKIDKTESKIDKKIDNLKIWMLSAMLTQTLALVALILTVN